MSGPILASATPVGTVPQATDLTVLANVKSYLGITTEDADPVLQRLISSASLFAQHWMGYDIAAGAMMAARSYTEMRDAVIDGAGWPNAWLYEIPVRWSPIVSVSSLTIDGYSVPSGGDPVQTPGFFFDPLQPWSVFSAGYFPCARGRKSIVVTYVGGYTAIPYDVEQAVIETVSLRFKERDRIGFRSKSLAGETVTFVTADFSDSAMSVLNKYRRMAYL